MTLAYLQKQGVCENHIEYAPDFSRFRITGGASYKAMNGPVPGDFSSAAFPAAAAIISGGYICLLGLEKDDTQGDKVFFEYLSRMGCQVNWEGNALRVSRGDRLTGDVFDLNATPDMLPVMAVLGAYAEGKTELVNAAHARIKETDRIAVMTAALAKLGVRCEEKPDGLVIYGGGLGVGGEAQRLDGAGDHRIVMALACAALGAGGPITIVGAEAADVSYPGFLELISPHMENER
jgi:3-phosphoshikimate 1-carboxyvinyltransferase